MLLANEIVGLLNQLYLVKKIDDLTRFFGMMI